MGPGSFGIRGLLSFPLIIAQIESKKSMCWSLEVTAAFSVIDIALLAFLFHRNRINDRLFVLFALPIAIQEILQLIVWFNIEETDKYSCNSVNIVTSFIIRIVVSLVPLTGTLLGVFAKSPTGKNTWEFNYTRILFLLFGFTVSFVSINIWIWRFMKFPHQGTIIGPNHHQIWPQYDPNIQQKFAPYSIFVYVMTACFPTLALLRPFWVALGLTVPISSFAVYFYLAYPIEYESIWCWSGVVIMVFSVIQAYIPSVHSYRKLSHQEAELKV